MFKETGKYLRNKRLEAGLTQMEVQAFLGYKGRNGFVSRAELGESMFGLRSIKRLIPKLNLNPDYLIEIYARDAHQTLVKRLKKTLKKA